MLTGACGTDDGVCSGGLALTVPQRRQGYLRSIEGASQDTAALVPRGGVSQAEVGVAVLPHMQRNSEEFGLFACWRC